MSSNKQAISLEFFPPRDIAAQEKLVRSAKQLLALHPAYVSVTFGAGGSTRSGTADTVRLMQNLGCDAAPHLSCIGATRAVLADIRSEEHTSDLQSLMRPSYAVFCLKKKIL